MIKNEVTEKRPENPGVSEESRARMNGSIVEAVMTTPPVSEATADNDAASLRLWKNGNVRGYNELIQRYERPLFHFVYRMIRDADEAKDVLQETFVRFYKSLSKLQEDRSLKSWLFQTAHHLCVDFLRKYKPGRVMVVDYQDQNVTAKIDTLERDHPIAADKKMMDRQTQDQIIDAIQSLPKQQQIIMNLRCRQEMSLQEIAHTVGCSEKTVGTTLFAARKKLLKKLRPVLEEFYGNSALG